MGIFSWYTLWMCSQVPEDGLDEQIVGRNSHGPMVPTTGLQDYLGTPEKANYRLDAKAANEGRVGYSHTHLYDDQ
jgi:hypothetical protein